ncbi:hypothetical protein MI467_12780 [Delftia acidovorans]|uniref:hypothetical protein n=1 Tax=Delftia acidovorans TaxID=80866 RepID=UPI001EFC378A|nr:hypothetical protein [Delftia acidovorans]MCG8987710.1 hypothetical protein [Delftia acidovorans]
MTTKKNAASEAVGAPPCQKQPDVQPRDAIDCIALGRPLSALPPPLSDACQQDLSACRRMFGGLHPEDVIDPLRTAAEALEWVVEISKTIEAEAASNTRIRRLASMAAFVAMDVANLTESSYEDMLAAIKKGGAL